MDLVGQAGETERSVAIVFCGDDRRIEWGKILAPHFTIVFGLGRSRSYKPFESVNGAMREGSPVPHAQVPKNATAIFVHTGELQEFSDYVQRVATGHCFDFNEVGTPLPRENTIRILRRTLPFELTDQDAAEIFAYVTRFRSELPKCCQSLPNYDLLSAIAILCQGYLTIRATDSYVRGMPLSGTVKAAVEQMGWTPSLAEQLQPRLAETNATVEALSWWDVLAGVSTAATMREEWGDSDREGLSMVNALLRRVLSAEHAVATAQLAEAGSDGDRVGAAPSLDELVAVAYCALMERLRGRPCPAP
jgi:hypothetical protein